jgi:hypothetical protein
MLRSIAGQLERPAAAHLRVVGLDDEISGVIA